MNNRDCPICYFYTIDNVPVPPHTCECYGEIIKAPTETTEEWTKKKEAYDKKYLTKKKRNRGVHIKDSDTKKSYKAFGHRKRYI